MGLLRGTAGLTCPPRPRGAAGAGESGNDSIALTKGSLIYCVSSIGCRIAYFFISLLGRLELQGEMPVAPGLSPRLSTGIVERFRLDFRLTGRQGAVPRINFWDELL
jgi:hypothetical protein